MPWCRVASTLAARADAAQRGRDAEMQALTTTHEHFSAAVHAITAEYA